VGSSVFCVGGRLGGRKKCELVSRCGRWRQGKKRGVADVEGEVGRKAGLMSWIRERKKRRFSLRARGKGRRFVEG